MNISTESKPRFDEKRNLWIADINMGYGADGKRRRVRVTSRTRGGVIRKRREKVQDLATGKVLPGKCPTLNAWSEYWLSEIAVSRTRPNTLANYRYSISAHILPALGASRLDRISVQDVREMLNKIEAKGLSARTQQVAFNILSSMLKDAVREDKIGSNPCEKMDRPRVKKPDPVSLSLAEARAVVGALKQSIDPLASRWLVALLLGMREGEALGLTWDRVDFDAGIIVVDRQLKEMPMRHGCGGKSDSGWPCGKVRSGACPDGRIDSDSDEDYEVLEGSVCFARPKTSAGIRVVPMPGVVVDALAKHRDATSIENEWGLVWCTENGRPIRRKRDRELWLGLLDGVGVRRVKLHAARHTMASLLLDGGVSPEVIRQIAGHSDVVATRSYMHLGVDSARDALEGLAGRM